jgi:deubiquitinase DESI2
MRLPENIKPKVYLNVYSASADESGFSGVLGIIGVYHSGVEVNGVEYAFAGVTGIYECRAGDYGPILQQIEIGESALTNRDIDRALYRLRGEFRGDQYHVVLRNCNHFSDSLVKTCTGKGIPNWINRAAWIASWCKCFMQGNDRFEHVPQAAAPLSFCGDGVRLSANESQPLTPGEQREIRLRNLENNSR